MFVTIRLMSRSAHHGNRIRRLRKRAGWTQAELARRLAISASYLNLLENDKRALTVPLLLKLAELFDVDLASFAADEEAELVADVGEALGDRLFEDEVPDAGEVRELARHAPSVGRSFLRLYKAYREARDRAQTMAAELSDSDELFGLESVRVPSEEVSDLIQEHENHFPVLESAAEELRQELAGRELEPGLAGFLEGELGVRLAVETSARASGLVRRYDPDRKMLVVSEVLPRPSRAFQLAHQIGLLTLRPQLDELVRSRTLTTDDSRALGRVALANYFAAAVLMPYEPFLEAARTNRYDIEILEHRFQATFEQVCHRMTSLNRPGAGGVPFHMVRMDIAGNITKRFSRSGIRFARYSGACPRWNVHGAFMTPGQIRTQVSQMPDGTRYFCIARTVRKAGGGFRVPQSRLAIGLGCEVQHAPALVYADGVDLDHDGADVPIGTSCRLCERMDCRQRAFPPLHHGLAIDENRRGLSFFSSSFEAGARARGR